MYVKKGNNRELFDKNRIRNAIISAYNQIGMPDFKKIDSIVDDLVEEITDWNEVLIDVKDIENIVMSYLYKELPLVAREYSGYKMNKERAEKNPSEIEKVLFVNPEIEHENGNKNPHLVHIKNAYLAEIPSKEMMMKLLPKECVEAHNKSIVYFHDSSYSAREMVNCTKGDAWIDVRKTDKKESIAKTTIEDFFNLFDRSNKECLINLEEAGYQILARDGWTRILRMNRRKLNNGEKIYQIKPRNGLPLNLTAKHRLPILRGNDELLLEVDKIKVGDSLMSFDENKLQQIVSIETYEEDCFVYDIETETHWYNINNYFSHNCCLYNLEELFNGCMINGVYIETPKSFQTACTVASQALSHATSCQYGGITINLLHLAKFVDVSRQKIRKEVDNELSLVLDNISDSSDFNYKAVREKIVEERLQKEIEQGMQTFLYQTNTLCSGTGQAAFLSVSCWLNEDERYTNDLILVFKELIKQRIKGIRQEDGTYLNPNFPKILYFLDEDTMKGGKYYDITRMCAECSSKRLVPDYLSVRKHKELKGVPTPPMGK